MQRTCLIDFSKFPAADTRLGVLLRLPLKALPSHLVVPILQGPLRGRKWIVGSSIHRCWLGSYEPAKVELVARLTRPGMVAFDIGAHVGLYTILFSQLTGSTGRVVAFEPLPSNVQYLREHVRLNGLANVTIVQSAVAERQGRSRFTRTASTYTGHLANDGDIQVDQVGIDQLIAADSVPAPDLMKIDVEGAEEEVLAGASHALRTRKPIVLLSTHTQAAQARCCEILQNCGYATSAINGRSVENSDEIVAIPSQSQLGSRRSIDVR